MIDIPILYEDKYLLLCQKPAGVPSQQDISGQEDCLSILAQRYPKITLIHRLDVPTGGVMMYAKAPAYAGKLSGLVQTHGEGGMCKTYLAVLSNTPDFEEGQLTDLLFHDKQKNKAFVVQDVRKGVKEARLLWKKLCTDESGKTLVSVSLLTGRTHQIRVQFASRGCPVCGDGKYGSKQKCPYIALWSHRVQFVHPFTGKLISAESYPDKNSIPWNSFSF